MNHVVEVRIYLIQASSNTSNGGNEAQEEMKEDGR